MHALHQGNAKGVQTLFDQLSANLTKLTKMYQPKFPNNEPSNHHSIRDYGTQRYSNNDNPDWVYDAPSVLPQFAAVCGLSAQNVTATANGCAPILTHCITHLIFRPDGTEISTTF